MFVLLVGTACGGTPIEQSSSATSGGGTQCVGERFMTLYYARIVVEDVTTSGTDVRLPESVAGDHGQPVEEDTQKRVTNYLSELLGPRQSQITWPTSVEAAVTAYIEGSDDQLGLPFDDKGYALMGIMSIFRLRFPESLLNGMVVGRSGQATLENVDVLISEQPPYMWFTYRVRDRLRGLDYARIPSKPDRKTLKDFIKRKKIVFAGIPSSPALPGDNSP